MRKINFCFSKGIGAILYSALLLIVLMLGLWGGWKIASGYYEPEIKRLNDALDKVQKSSNTEVKFWQDTLKALADEDQFKGIDLKGRPSKGD